MMPSSTGRFLTFEGIDGTGKSTQARLLAERLRAEGYTVLLTREPGGTPVGRHIRALLLDSAHGDLVPKAELLLFLADRLQHLHQVIRPALARGEWVISDRYHDATLAYQQFARGLDVQPLADFMAQEVDKPWLTLWLDLPLEVALQRISQRQTTPENPAPDTPPALDESRLEADVDFLRRVQQGYAALAQRDPARMVRVDASPSPEAVAAAVYQVWQSKQGV